MVWATRPVTQVFRAYMRGQERLDVVRVKQELQRFARWMPDAVAINETREELHLWTGPSGVEAF
jgi:hypothetical protein